MLEFNNFDTISISLASPERIRNEWSFGEVKKPETINYRTLKPEKDGLFCEKIFGTTKDWECSCGKYKKVKYKGVVCDRCGVELTKSSVRRERMGHIELAAPVSHIWYFKTSPSKMGLLLGLQVKELEKVLYYDSYIVLEAAKDSKLVKNQILNDAEYMNAKKEEGDKFRAAMGAEAIKELLQTLDLDALSLSLRNSLKSNQAANKRTKDIKRLEIVESFRKSGNKPEWMILDCIPVIPPDLRPMVQLDGGRFATSDLNDLYRRVINRNNRLKDLIEKKAPEIICRNEKRMLQEAVDALIDNGRRGKPVEGPNNRELKSLSEMLKGKQGRFRQNLLGKRVDYSGRSVIVVGPDLKFYQCGLPKTMALELFKPFVMRELVANNYVHNIKGAKRMIEKLDPKIWDVVERVIKNHPVLLNRAPTLHRLGIQAFEPVLIEGKAIRLHPLVCTAYNADFDGDQMAVHVPLSVEAQAEARFLMLSTNNILAPKDGSPITNPSQDMVLGTYYLTMEAEEKSKNDRIQVFRDYDEMLMSYNSKEVAIHDRVGVRIKLNENDRGKIVYSTVGRFIFNEIIPQDLGFVDREKDPYSLEVDFECTKKMQEKIIAKCFAKYGNTRTVIMLDDIKDIGYRFSTRGAISISVSDMDVPKQKWDIINKAEEEVKKYERAYRRGLISDDERHEIVIDIWTKTTNAVTSELENTFNKNNSIYIMAHSGARGSINQIRQLAGMRGLMANAIGETVEIPIKSNFREGLTVLEYFISTTGARKGNADTALRTADSGYLTRRLVDVAQDVVVREKDCGSDKYIIVKEYKDGPQQIEPLIDRIKGRCLAENIYYKDSDEILASKNQLVDEALGNKIIEQGYTEVKVRSILSCKLKVGVCARCYGLNLATGRPVDIGEAVGIIAAQSIGEPGTQLTMRTFHTGGVAGGDITQGLPRVEELFEARKPKALAVIAEADGVISFKKEKKKDFIIITKDNGEEIVEQIVFGSSAKVKEGDRVKAGDILTSGSANPSEILRILGVKGVEDYITKEVQKVYRQQGEDIADKHIEIIIKQMLSKVLVEDSGDTELLPGQVVNAIDYEEQNTLAIEKGLEPAVAKPLLLSITKASLTSESFLSSASFQQTTTILTDAAIKGREDKLMGLKENVIIGKLIPAGTGIKRYKNLKIKVLDENSYNAMDLI